MSKVDNREKLSAALQRELDPGETILWSGFPSFTHLRTKSRDTIILSFLGAICAILAFGLLIALAVYMRWVFEVTEQPASTPDFWTFFSNHEAAGDMWILTVFPLALASLSFLSIPYYRHIAHEHIYAITTNRAIVLQVKKKGDILERDYCAKELAHLSRFEKPDGTGNVVFQGARGAYASSQVSSGHGFYAIENVIEVERMLRKQFGHA